MIPQRAGATRADAYEIALNRVAGAIKIEVDAVIAIAGNHVAVARVRSADEIAGAFHPDAFAAVALRHHAVHIRSDEIALDHVRCAEQNQSFPVKTVHGQTAHGAEPGRQLQAHRA